MYIHTHIYIYICIYMYTWIYVYMCTCMTELFSNWVTLPKNIPSKYAHIYIYVYTYGFHFCFRIFFESHMLRSDISSKYVSECVLIQVYLRMCSRFVFDADTHVRVAEFPSWDVTHVNESWHTFKGVIKYIWMSHGTHMNEACLTYTWVMSRIEMSHVTHFNGSPCQLYEWAFHTNERVMAHRWWGGMLHMSHVTRRNESCHTY